MLIVRHPLRGDRHDETSDALEPLGMQVEPDPRSPGDSPHAREEGGIESRLRLLRVVATAANEARSIQEALKTCLDEVCAHTGWPIGHAFLREPDRELLRSSRVWHLDDEARYRDFRELSEAQPLGPGEGLPGKVWTTGKPQWIRDVRSDPEFIRVGADDNGLRSALAFPILAGPEVVGVLEFYTPEAMEPDALLFDLMAQIGVQIGRVVERERTGEALRLSEAKFAGIIDISADAVVSVDEEQRIVVFNRGAERIFGYAREEVLGKSLDLLIPERFRGDHRDQVAAFGDGPVDARRMGERGHITGRRKSGEIFPADASISRLNVAGRRFYTAVLRDITDRVQTEQELARSNAELEQFAYVASHDLQEPLRMVASFTQLLARRYGDKLDEEAVEFIDFAVDGVRRMQALINDLLAFSRVGTRGLPFEPVDTAKVVDRVLASLGPAIEESGARVTAGTLPVISGDAVQLDQVFQNLIANALKFRKPDVPPEVSVTARRGIEEWIFSISDNGIGIAPEYAERVFILFQRLHSRTEYPGTGIGLAICKKIVERHGGRIWFDSTPGKGTTFVFSIPDYI